MLTIQLTNHMKLNKKEGQSVDASIFLRRKNKIITGGTYTGEGRRREERGGRKKAVITLEPRICAFKERSNKKFRTLATLFIVIFCLDLCI